MRPRYTLRVPDEIAGLLRGLHPDLKRKVKGSLKIILDGPDAGKPLKDELEGLKSFRVSRLRIIYRVDASKREIAVVAVGPRRSIYRETYRLLTRKR